MYCLIRGNKYECFYFCNFLQKCILSEVDVQKYHITLHDLLRERFIEYEILDYLSTSDILLTPEEYTGIQCYNIDLIDFKKKLERSGLKVTVINPQCSVIEKKTGDIVIDVGIIVKDIILQLVLSLIASFLYDKLKSSIQKKDIPKATITFYQKEKEKRIKYEGPADKVAEVLEKFNSERDSSR